MTKQQLDMLSQAIIMETESHRHFFLLDFLRKYDLEYLRDIVDDEYSISDALLAADVDFTPVCIRYTINGPKHTDGFDYLIGFSTVSELVKHLKKNLMRTYDYRFEANFFGTYGKLTDDILHTLDKLFTLFDKINSKVNSTEELDMSEFQTVIETLYKILNEETINRWFSYDLLLVTMYRVCQGRAEGDDLETFVDLWCNQVTSAVENLKEFLEQYKREAP